MAVIDNAPVADTEGADTSIEAIKEHLAAASTMKGDRRDVSKAGVSAAFLAYGVTDKMVKQVQEASDGVSSAAFELAADDLVARIEGSSKEQLADDDYRRGMSSTVRLATHGGRTDVSVSTEKVNNIPFRGSAEGGDTPQTKTTYGRMGISVSAQGRIHKDLPGKVTDRIKAALNIAD